jgi:hypothetical protein
MNPGSRNPYDADPDRQEIWEILMRRDLEAFVAVDWARVEPDFLAGEFQGIDAGKQSNPDLWRLRFADLATYRAEWISQAEDFRKSELQGVSRLDFLFASIVLQDIEISGPRAMAHKKFLGSATTTLGAPLKIEWQTLYLLREVESHWKITGFVGFLPNRQT